LVNCARAVVRKARGSYCVDPLNCVVNNRNKTKKIKN